MSLESALIAHCAPTLARLKPGSLFSVVSPRWGSLYAESARLNKLLGEKGLRLIVVPAGGRALCYLYRESALARTLADEDARAFLRARGYRSLCVRGALETLCARLAAGGEFPHEIGLFLGYPLADVVAFIRTQGRGCALCGCWKAYSDPGAARETFARYEKCTQVYRRLYGAGRTLLDLTVAA